MSRLLSRSDFLRAIAALGTQACAQGPMTEAPATSSEQPRVPSAPLPETPQFYRQTPASLLIRGGTVHVGRGEAATLSDVVIDEGVISFIGDVRADQPANATLDAHGLAVAPGFIDLHSHADLEQSVDHLLAMGVTTVVLGQDGESPKEGVAGLLRRWKTSAPLNVATLAGHSSLRRQALGLEPRDIARRRARLSELVASSLAEGALGVSLGLEYDGARTSDGEELLACLKPLGAERRVAMAHLRSEDDDAIDTSIAEFFGACKGAGAHAHIAHLKVVLGKGEARAEAVLERLAKARADGLTVTADVYPYTSSYTTLAILFPPIARPPNRWDIAKKRHRKAILEHLRNRVNARNGPEATTFGPGPYRGRTLADVAADKKRPFEEVLMSLGPTGGQAAYRVMDEPLVKRLARDPFVAFGTDGSGESSHPRGHGTFSRVLGPWVRDERLYSLNEGIRKATHLAASILGLPDRGEVAIGKAADLAIFNPERLTDHASFEEPHALSSGVSHVIVNGELAWRDGVRTSARAGRALMRRSR